MNPKILIADDEPHMRRIIELSLRKAGCEVLVARDGREAVEVAARELPALVVLDVSMPGVDGFMALRQLKASPATAAIPVIVLTSRGHAVAREEAATSGAALYVTKPFSPSALAAEVLRMVGDRA